MSRPRNSSSEQSLRGNTGKRRRPAAASALPAPSEPAAPKIPAPPAWLTVPAALTEWSRIAPILTRTRVLTTLDETGLAQYCQAFAGWLSAQEDLALRGATYETASKHGTMTRVNPALKVADSMERTMRRLEQQLGLGPLSRFRLATAAASAGAQTSLFDLTPDSAQTHGLSAQKTEADSFFGYAGASKPH